MKMWTHLEIKWLKKNYANMLVPQMAKSLGRSTVCIATKVHELGLKKEPGDTWRLRSQRQRPVNGWQPEQEKELRRLVNHYTIAEIATIMGKKRGGVKSKVQSMGLRIAPKVVAAAYKRPNAGRFQKGHRGIGDKELPLFSVVCRIHDRGYPEIFIKRDDVSKKPQNWVLLSVYLWELKNGRVPKGKMVAFKDGNRLNVTYQNLMCITMKENMERNSGSVNLPDSYVARLMARKGRKPDQALAAEFLKHPGLIKAQRNLYNLKRLTK